VVSLNRAAALARVAGPEAALAMIEPLEDRLCGYFYFYGAKGALLLQLGRQAEARQAFDQAIGLATSATEAAHIRQQIDRLAADTGPGEKTSAGGVGKARSRAS
jgi:RNA polymerase sigma-70 factor (ECF subfamily)